MAKIRVGYLGVDQFTFGYMAMSQYFTGRTIESVKHNTHADICESVGNKKVKLGVVAIENTLDGMVPETARAMERADRRFGVKILGEFILPIKLYYANSSGNPTDAKKVLSHPSALGQCSYFVRKLWDQGVSNESRSSTSEAAKEASANGSIAVLSSIEAIKHYNLKLLEEKSITNHESSATRFWIIGKEHAKRTGDDKTCFLVSLDQQKVGSLYKTFGVFAETGVNVYVIYPISIFGKQWEYTFMIEVKGHIDDAPIKKACESFETLGIALHGMQFLGSYPNKSDL
ncbi:MAG: prephenate dehydratase domain-containing protein [bacterium]|nr:prephenate dehydratase domain-containing protein [bacterium]